MCAIGQICNRCTGLVACKLIAFYTANTYSVEREMSASACTRSMAGCVVVMEVVNEAQISIAVCQLLWSLHVCMRNAWL